MSLLIDNGLVLSNTTSTDRNTINSNGNNLEVTTSAGNLLLNTTSASGFIVNPNMDFGGSGELHKVAEVRGTTSADTVYNAVNSSLILNTNSANALTINSTGTITFASQPRLNTATSSTLTNQWMSMNNCMTTTTFTPTLTGTTGSAVLASTSYGRYTRIADLVFITINIVVSSSTVPDGDNCQIGIPINSATGFTNGLIISNLKNIDMATVTSYFDCYVPIASNQSYVTIAFHQLATDDTTVTLKGSQIGAGTEFTISGFYFV